MGNLIFINFFLDLCQNFKKNVELPFKKVTKNDHFLGKKKMKMMLPMGENMFFFPIFDKISRSKIKIRTFCDFFDSKFELYGSKFDTKNDQKNHVKKEFQGSVVGGGVDFDHGQIGRNWFRKKIDFFFR